MKFLLIQLKQLGDVLMTTPAIRALRQAYPQSVIHYLTLPHCLQAVENNPCLDRVLNAADLTLITAFFRFRQIKYDAVIDFMASPRSARLTRLTGAPMRIGMPRRGRRYAYTHFIEPPRNPLYSAIFKTRFVEPLSVSTTNYAVDLEPSDTDVQAGMDLLNSFQLEKGQALAAVSPVSRRAYKRWPLEHFAAACDTITRQKRLKWLPLFGPGEEKVVEELIACSRYPNAFLYPYAPPRFPGLKVMLARCAFYFGNDNGIRHIAIAAGLPTCTIFGRPDPVDWTPPGSERHVVFRGKEELENIQPASVSSALKAFLI